MSVCIWNPIVFHHVGGRRNNFTKFSNYQFNWALISVMIHCSLKKVKHRQFKVFSECCKPRILESYPSNLQKVCAESKYLSKELKLPVGNHDLRLLSLLYVFALIFGSPCVCWPGSHTIAYFHSRSVLVQGNIYVGRFEPTGSCGLY